MSLPEAELYLIPKPPLDQHMMAEQLPVVTIGRLPEALKSRLPFPAVASEGCTVKVL